MSDLRKLSEAATLPDPKLMAPLKAVPVDDALNDWLVAYQTGNSGVDGKDWAIVTDRVNASAFYYLEFPGDAKEDAEAIVSILMAFRSGSLIPRSRYEHLLALLAEAREALRMVSSGLNNAFAAGTEEREYGSAHRQEKAMEKVETTRSTARATLSRIDDALAAEPEARR